VAIESVDYAGELLQHVEEYLSDDD